MKRIEIIKYVIIGVILSGLLFTSCEDSQTLSLQDDAMSEFIGISDNGATDINGGNLSDNFTTESSSLTDAEIEGLQLMREEEKLARDVYATFNNEYGLRIFENISQSEGTHTNAMLELIQHFNIEDPATDTPGEFNNSSLQSLHDSLVNKGMDSPEAALRTGATIEELDIVDLRELIAETDNEDITLVYENLLKGSRNHLRAFNRVMDNYGVDYSPAHLSSEDYEEIVTSDMEKQGYRNGNCNGDGARNGNGNGNGMGNGNGRGNGNGNGTCDGSGNPN